VARSQTSVAPIVRAGASGEGEGGGGWFFEACGGFKFRKRDSHFSSFRGASKMRAPNPSSRGN